MVLFTLDVFFPAFSFPFFFRFPVGFFCFSCSLSPPLLTLSLSLSFFRFVDFFHSEVRHSGPSFSSSNVFVARTLCYLLSTCSSIIIAFSMELAFFACMHNTIYVTGTHSDCQCIWRDSSSPPPSLAVSVSLFITILFRNVMDWPKTNILSLELMYEFT